MVKPIPENVKICLSELSAAQQVTLRGYIGSLRAEMKTLEEEIRTVSDPDPHAHYHGHEKCTGKHSFILIGIDLSRLVPRVLMGLLVWFVGITGGDGFFGRTQSTDDRGAECYAV